MVVVWLSIGAALVVVELSHLAFFALFAALGCFAAAGVAALWPSAVGVQIVAVLVVAIAGIVGIRPFLREAITHSRGAHRSRGVHGGIVGEEVLTLDDVGDAARVGHVRLAGERWLACSGDGTVIPAGTTVVVTAVRGTTLTVWPVGGFGPNGPPELGTAAQQPEPGQQPKEEQS